MRLIKEFLNVYRYIAVRLAIAIAVFLLGITLSHAATLDSSNTAPHKIFSCQATTITANYSNFADINSVYAVITNSHNGYIETIPMTALGSGSYSLSYGNDNTTAWGNRTISFIVASISGNYTNITGNYIFVYSDPCTGTNIQSYKNVTYRDTGFGKYTKVLFSGDANIFEFATQPYIDYFGYMIYVIVMFVFCGVLYMKTQSVVQPLLMAFISSALIIGSGFIPEASMAPYKLPIIFLMGIAMTAIFWRLIKSA